MGVDDDGESFAIAMVAGVVAIATEEMVVDGLDGCIGRRCDWCAVRSEKTNMGRIGILVCGAIEFVRRDSPLEIIFVEVIDTSLIVEFLD